MLLNGHERGEGHLGVEYGPLHAAARVGALEVCQELISAGYKVQDDHSFECMLVRCDVAYVCMYVGS